MFGKKNPDHEILEQRLRQCSVFKGFRDSELKTLLRIAHIRDYSSGERVFTEGTVGLCFYVIVRGSVNMVTPESAGSNVIRDFKEGDFFSEIHLFSETNHSVSCVANEVTKLLIFSKPDIEDLIKIDPKLGNKILLSFLDFLGQKLDGLHRENIELAQNNKA